MMVLGTKGTRPKGPGKRILAGPARVNWGGATRSRPEDCGRYGKSGPK